MAKIRLTVSLLFLACCSALGQQQSAILTKYSVHDAAMGSTFIAQQPPQYQLRSANRQGSRANFWVLTTVVAGLTIADVELSQACLQRQTCIEANPLLPRSRVAAYGIQLPLSAGVAFLSNRSRIRGSRRWWLPEMGVTAGHVVGVASGIRAMF